MLGMLGYALRRILLIVPTLLGISVIVFLVMRVLPGDPATAILSSAGGASVTTQRNVEALRSQLGTDRPLLVQYFQWAYGVSHLDFGTSLITRQPIVGELKRGLPLSLELSLFSLVGAILIGIPMGALSAVFANRPTDYLLRFVSVLGTGAPVFWTGTLLIMLTISLFGWAPRIRYTPPWEDLPSNLGQMLLPAATLGYFLAAVVARMTRSTLLEVLREDYVRTARAKGLAEKLVVTRHALRNALLPIVTILGINFGHLLGGVVVVEMVFTLPGIGLTLVDAIKMRDYPVVQSIVLLIALFFAAINLLVDFSYGLLDPRIRYSRPGYR